MYKNNSPIFITGTWRSGTTTLSRMINAHPDINVIYDGIHLLKYISDEDIKNKTLKNIKKKMQLINKFAKKRFEKKIVIINKDLKNFYIETLNQLTNNNKKIKGEKSNVQWSKIPIFFKLFPKGRVIHIIRDPRGVLASWKKFTYAKGNRYLDSIFNCFGSLNSAIEYSKIFKNKRYVLIKYEDLISNPEIEMRKTFKKLDIKFHRNVINPKYYKSKKNKRWKANSSFKLTSKRYFNIKSIDIWKKKLNDYEIFLIENILHDKMKFFKYKKFQKKTALDKKNYDIIKNKFLGNKFLLSGLMDFLIFSKGQERVPVKRIK